MVPNLTRQSEKYFELMYKLNKIIDLSIFPNIALIRALISNLCTILYSSGAKILYITRLHFIENWCIIFVLLVALVKQMV